MAGVAMTVVVIAFVGLSMGAVVTLDSCRGLVVAAVPCAHKSGAAKCTLANHIFFWASLVAFLLAAKRSDASAIFPAILIVYSRVIRKIRFPLVVRPILLYLLNWLYMAF